MTLMNSVTTTHITILITIVVLTSTLYTIYPSLTETDIFAQTAQEMVDRQGQEVVVNNTLNLNGRISSMLLPVSPSMMSDNASSMMMGDSSMMINSNSNSSRNNAMKFSMAQNVAWLLSGDWKLGENTDNKTVTFDANFTKVTTDGTMKHAHRISNFTMVSQPSSSYTQGIINLSGVADVYFNNELAWKQAKIQLSLLNNEVLKIDINSIDIDNHFHGEPIYGVISTS